MLYLSTDNLYISTRSGPAFGWLNYSAKGQSAFGEKFNPMTYISGGNTLLDPQAILGKLDLMENFIVADLGCGGAGHFTFPAAKMVGKHGQVYAVDILKTVLTGIDSKAKLEGVHNVKTVWSDLEIYGATKISEQTVDACLVINVLFQSKKHLALLKEGVRLLKSGGKLLIIDWKQTGAPFGPPVADRVKPEDLKRIAADLGLNLLEEFDAGQYHYGLIFQSV